MATSTTLPGIRASGPAAARGLAKYLVVLGRVLFALIFVFAAPTHFQEGTIALAASQGVPLAQLLVPASGILALVGGVSVAVGYRARWGAWMLVLFLIPVTLMMHRFWAAENQAAMEIQRAMFMKNLSLLGAALILAVVGPGPGALKD